MARKRVQRKIEPKAEGRTELHLLLLGIVAILAIVGLVLMFNARMTGQSIAGIMNPTIWGKENACFNVMPVCDNGPRTPISQYLGADKMIHYACGCPNQDPPVPTIEIVVPLE